mgnify:CR=1 FL=1
MHNDVIQQVMYAVRFSPEEEALIESYRQLTGMTISEIIRSSTIQRIEDELDSDMIREALSEYRSNPKTFTFEEEMKRLGLE